MVVYVVVTADERVGYVYEDIRLVEESARILAGKVKGIVLKVDTVTGREEKLA